MPTKKAHPQPKKIFRETDERTERMSDLECGHDVEDGEVWCPECGTHRKLRRAVVQPEPQIVELTRELERQTNCALISQAAFQRERDRAEAAEARLTVLEAHEGALPDVIALLKTIKGGIEQWCSSSRDQAFNPVYREWRDCRPEKIVALVEHAAALLAPSSPAPADKEQP